MKNLKIFGVVIVAVMFLASCGGGGSKEPAKVKPDKTSISGALGDYLQIVDGEYEIVDDWGGNLNVKVKKIKAAPSDFLENKEFDLTASVLQENGMPVSGTEDFELDYSSKDKVISLLKGNSDEEIILLKSQLGGYHQEEHSEKAKKFSVSSILKEKEESSSSTSSASYSDNDEEVDEDEESYSSSSSSENWDAVLDSYEKYIDQYIKLLKKAQNGDMSAMTEYVEMMEKATDLAEKMENADDDLSASQMSRFVKLQTKLANAAANL